MSSQQVDNEIDLLGMFTILWESKRLIAAITAVFAAVSVIGAFLVPSDFEGRLKITALTNQQMAAYQILNNTPNISPPIIIGGTKVGQTGVILKEDLFQNFIDLLNDGAVFANALKKLDPDFRDFDGSETVLKRELALASGLFETTFDKGSDVSVTLSFETDDRELSQTIVKTAINEAREIARLENLEAISNLRHSIETTLAFELEDVNNSISNALAKYEDEKDSRQALLKEHAAIARQLGNADGQAVTSENSGVNVAVEQQQPLYNRGYVALEKELALIDARGKGEAVYPFVTEFVSLAAEKRKLETDTRLSRIDIGLGTTPLVDQSKFIPANYNLDTMTYKAKSSKALIVILTTLMGGFIAVIYALISNALLTRNKSQGG